MPAKKKPAPKKRGRPTKRNATVERKIMDGLSSGTPLTVICSPDSMPHTRTVNEWAASDPEFSSCFACARDEGWDRLALDALEIANTPIEGTETVTGPDGEKITRKDMLGHRRLQVDTRLKLLARWDAKRYGERMTQEITGADGGPIQTSTAKRSDEDELRFAKMIAAARKRLDDKK